MTSEQLATARKLIVFLTAITALLTAIFKPQNHDVTKVSYEELSVGLEKLNAAVAANHDDVVMLRGYVAKMDGERLIAPIVVVDAGAVVSAPAGASAPKRTTPVVIVAPPSSAGPPPPVHEAAPQYHPPKFDAVLRMAN
jgi:hypothetical protein